MEAWDAMGAGCDAAVADDEDEDDAEDIEVCGGLGPPGDELLAGVGELSGTDSRALTASRWSLLDMSELTVSSSRTFSCRNWCRHDSSDAMSKCCACSIRNWLPCSHCRSSNCSRLCGKGGGWLLALMLLPLVFSFLPGSVGPISNLSSSLYIECASSSA